MSPPCSSSPPCLSAYFGTRGDEGQTTRPPGELSTSNATLWPDLCVSIPVDLLSTLFGPAVQQPLKPRPSETPFVKHFRKKRLLAHDCVLADKAGLVLRLCRHWPDKSSQRLSKMPCVFGAVVCSGPKFLSTVPKREALLCSDASRAPVTPPLSTLLPNTFNLRDDVLRLRDCRQQTT